MKIKILILCIFFITNLFAQRVIDKKIPVKGDIFLTEGIAIPKTDRGYTLWLPENEKVKGLVVFTHARRDTVHSEFIIDYALSKQLAVLYATTENRLEFFFEDDKIQEIENYIHEVITNHNIPDSNLLYCGMSLEGTRALKLAMFSQSNQSKYKLVPKAIAICDSPLDMVRFHREMVKAKELNFNPITANEGTWVSGYLERNLGGTPIDTLKAYIDYSPYCYAANGGPNLNLLENIAIRCYTEPDVNWWIETRRKDYYSMNAIDLAALINELKIRGNQNAELIITQNKGYQEDGSRHPHTWNIVDEKELVDWFIELIE
ncbi:MAG: hypothetical protein D6813_06640 [Calditrichaeota bacterium]|nr:MAG: hypothetical protein D6813_06640 [Calditrichota bacterium]